MTKIRIKSAHSLPPVCILVVECVPLLLVAQSSEYSASGRVSERAKRVSHWSMSVYNDCTHLSTMVIIVGLMGFVNGIGCIAVL